MANNKSKNNKSTNTGAEAEELSSEDYAIIGAGLIALGDFFAFLSLVKAKEVAKETGGEVDLLPLALIRSKKKR